MKKWRHFSEWTFKKASQLHLVSYSCLYLYNQTHITYLIAYKYKKRRPKEQILFFFFKPLIIFHSFRKTFWIWAFSFWSLILGIFFSCLFALHACTLSTIFQVFALAGFSNLSARENHQILKNTHENLHDHQNNSNLPPWWWLPAPPCSISLGGSETLQLKCSISASIGIYLQHLEVKRCLMAQTNYRASQKS